MKGISSLIASILLIAFTLAVAVIIGSWLTSISSQQASNIGGQANQTATCAQAVLEIASIPNNNTVIIRNAAGQIDLSGNFTLSCGTNVTTTSSVSLPAGGMASLTSSECQVSGSKISVSSQVCSKYVECTYGSNCP
jgi:flagellin-like protein